MLLELERFIAVFSEGSFTRAAKKLFITQPALSLSIARLEKAIGAKFFKRIGKRFVLTKDGKLVYQMGIQILKLWSKIKDPSFRMQAIKPLYSIGLYDNAALRLSKYFQKNLSQNDFRFEITIDSSGNLIRGFQNGIHDLCLCIINSDTQVKKEASLIKIFSEKLLPVSSKIWGRDFDKIPLILYNKESITREFIDKVFLQNGIKPNIIVESTSPGFMKELAIGGCGVALLPKNFIERELEQKKLFVQKFPFTFQRKIGLFLSKDSNLKDSDEMVKGIIKNLS